MTAIHRCQWCDQDYPCDTMQEVAEDVYRCECKSTDTCPGCSEHGACEDCGKKPAGNEYHQFLCDDCAENKEPPEPDLSGPTRRELDAFDLMRERRHW